MAGGASGAPFLARSWRGCTTGRCAQCRDLVPAARHAWRRAARCVGRAGWTSLAVRDARDLGSASDVAHALTEHLVEATNAGSVRPTLTVLPTDVRVVNEQLVRYADDPQYRGFAASAVRAGWDGRGRRFELLPLVILDGAGRVSLHRLPPDAVLEVPIVHPRLAWFERLALRWHAVPVVSNMLLRLPDLAPDGTPCGATYPVAFNGWYVSDEISARNLGGPDRYDVLPDVVRRLRAADRRTAGGAGDRDERDYWRQRALVELDRAVLHSFRRQGVKISSPSQEAHRFVRHVARERAVGRSVPADWSWTVSPIAPVLLPTYHRSYERSEPAPGPDLVHDPWLARAGRHGWDDDCPVPGASGAAGALDDT